MATERPISPPPDLMVRQINQPDHTVGYYSELVDRSSTRFQQLSPIRRGTPYSSGIGADQKVINLFGNQLFFLIERVPPSGIGGAPQDKFVVWHWGTQQKADNATNAQIDYLSESVNHPGFTRPVTLPRDVYEANPTVAYGSALTTLLHIRVTAGGKGYRSSDTVVIAGNLGGKADLVVDEKGTILNVIVTDEGLGYDSDDPPDVTVQSGTGTGATAVAIIQPKAAVLVSQKKVELPDNDPYSNEFVQVIRTYQVLPGPWVTSSLIDPDGIVVTVNKRKNLTANITGVETLSGGIWSETTAEGADSNIAEEVVKSRVVPGNSMTVTKDNEDGTVTTLHRTLKDQTLITFVDDVSGGIWTKTYQEDPPVFRGFALRCGDKVAWEIVETRPLPGNPIPSTAIDKNGDSVSITKTLAAASTIATTSSIVSGIWTKTFEEPVSNKVAWKVVEVRSTANALPFYSVEIPNVIPERMRAALLLDATETTVKGIASLPTLATGDLFRSQQQLDQYTYRLKIVNLALSSLPVIYVDHGITEKFGGGPITITWKLQADSSPDTIDEGLLVLDSSVVLLGNGTHLKKSEVRDGSAWPVLDETSIDETLHVPVPASSQVISRGTASSSVVGDTETEVHDIDYVRSKKVVTIHPTGDIATYARVLHNNCNLDLPLQLMSLPAYYGTHGGAGSAGDAATSYSLGGNGSGSLSVRASCQGSAAVVPELGHVLKAFRGHGLPCFHVLCLVARGTSRSNIRARVGAILTAELGGSITVLEWLAFSPQPITIRCIGKQSAVRLEASAGASSNTRYKFDGTIVTTGEGRRNGSSVSVEIGVNQKTLYIPAAIHAAISISGEGDTKADIGAAYNSSSVINASAWGGPITTSLATPHADGSVVIIGNGGDATPGVTAVPLSGFYLTPRGIMSEPDRKFDRIRVLAEVVDFANVI